MKMEITLTAPTGEVKNFAGFGEFAAWYDRAVPCGMPAQYWVGDAVYQTQNNARCSEERRADTTVHLHDGYTVRIEASEEAPEGIAPMLIRYKHSMGGIAEEEITTSLAALRAMPKRRRPSSIFAVDEGTGSPVLAICCTTDTCNCISHREITVCRLAQAPSGVWEFT